MHWKTRKGGKNRCSSSASKRFRPRLEELEVRRMLSVSLAGVPDWSEQGPGPLQLGQVDGMKDSPVSGAIQTIAQHPVQPDTLLVGSVNGGIWKTTNAN